MFVDINVNGQVVRAMFDTGVAHKFLSDLSCKQENPVHYYTK